MLMTTKMGINEIAQEVGFDNSSYFYRVFKNTFGVTPLKYRNHVEHEAARLP
jgi:AraC-like DNA-binding protein